MLLFYQNYAFTSKVPYINKFLKKYYTAQFSIVQFNPDCSRYDSELTYTLKEGECIFKNKEFSTKYNINHLGLRDDEESLVKPEIIVLGDSYAMGWGVNQDQSFPSIIEKELGLKTLNAGISSYGTAREYLLFNKLDISNLKYLIIQYCSNDFLENQIFFMNSELSNYFKNKEMDNLEVFDASMIL